MRLKTRTGLVLISAIFLLSGCASNPKDIVPTYVSDAGYRSMSCTDLEIEAEAVSRQAATADATQSKNATNDAVMTTVAVVVFWPALFFNKGDGNAAAQVARLKGEMVAIEHANDLNGCGIVFDTGAA